MRKLKTVLLLLFALIGTNAFAQTTFSLSQSEIACGEQTCLQVSVQGFTNVLAFQYSINWDAAILGNASVQSFGIGDLSTANFNLASPGIARIGWDDSNTTGVSLADNTVIFEICFDEIGGNTATSSVQFSDNPIVIEVIDAQGELINPNFNNGEVVVDCGTMDGNGDGDTGGGGDNSASTLTFSATQATANCGEQVCVDVNASGFSNVLAFQYSMNWDANLLGVATVQNFGVANMDASQFNATNAGILRVGYDDASLTGVNLPDNSLLFQVCFDLAADATGSTAIVFSDTPIAIEAIDVQGNILTTDFQSGNVMVNCDTDSGDGGTGGDNTGGDGMTDGDNGNAVDTLAFSAGQITANCGEQVCVDIMANGFTDIISFQYAMNWDTALLGTPTIGQFGLSDMNASHFNTATPGVLRVGYDDSSLQGRSLVDGAVLYQLCFDLATDAVGTSGIDFSATPIAIEVVDVQSNILTPELQNGMITVACVDTTVMDTMPPLAELPLGFSISTDTSNCGDQVCLDVSVQGFENITSFRYSINWNAQLLGSEEIGETNLEGIRFGPLAPGVFFTEWIDPTGQGLTLPDNEIIYTICFNQFTSDENTVAVSFSNVPIPIRVTNPNTSSLRPELTSGEIFITCNPIDMDTMVADVADSLNFSINNGTGNCEEQTCLAVTAQDFNDLFSFQYSITYSETLGAASVQNFGLAGLSEANFNLAEPGSVRVGWDDSSLEGVSIPDDQVLFDLCFDVGANISGDFEIAFSNTPLAIETVDVAGNVLNPSFQDGTLSITCTPTDMDTMVMDVADSLSFSINNATGNCAEQICLMVTAKDFNDIFSFQYSIAYNEILGAASVQNFGLAGLSAANFNLAEPGSVRVGWDDSSLEGVSIPDDQVLFDLCFDVGQNIAGGFEVAFSNTPLAIEAVDANGMILNPSFQDGALTITCEDTTPIDTTTTPEILQLTISDGTVNCGEQICLDVRARAFNDILSFQYSINWDPNVLGNAAVQGFNLAGLGAGNFNADAPGVIRAGWTDANVTGVTMAEDAILYQICFDAIGETATSTDVRFSNVPLPIEVLDGTAEPIEPQLQNGTVTVECMVIEPPVDTIPTNVGDELTFSLSQTTGDCTEQVCMEVRVNNFNNILTYQYSINWDANLLGPASVQGFNMAGLTAANFNTTAPGVLRVGWDDAAVAGVSLPDNQVIYQICFDNINEAIENLPVNFSGTPIPVEVVDNQNNLIEPEFINGNLTITCDDGNNGENPTTGDLIFRLTPTVGNCEEQICTDVRVDGFSDILSFQYSLIWDAAGLGTATVQSFGIPDLNASNFNNNTSGILRVGWDDTFITGVTLPNDHILFQVCFDAVDEPINNATVSFTGTPTSIEVIDRNGQFISPAFQDGTITVNCDTNTPIDADNDGFASDVDCDDNNPNINPNGVEIANNGIDENCDGVDLIENVAVDADNDGFTSDVDCDDNNPIIFPGATEFPNNNIDEDCDGIALFIDADNDGFNSSIDCDDNNPNINAGATEIPDNGIDEDCNGEDLVTIIVFPDNDGDGFTSDVDCDDNNPIVFPGATEFPNNNVDEDCDGIALFIDADNDGFNSSIDCDDNNPNINAGATEIPDNGIDEDCNGEDLVTIIIFLDNDGDGFTSDVDCDDNNPIVFPGATEFPNNNVDEDCDGVALFIDADNDGFNSSIDCDDNNPNINGRGIEIPDNGIDEDCDGQDLVTEIVLTDNDGDGFMSDVDCDDNNPIVFPGATEFPNNNVDEDCDGVALFIDADNDGFNSSIDCDDSNPNINGRGIEIPNNGIDEDCDGEDLVTVTDFPDNDGDGFTSDVDCDDNNPIIFPGATEYPNNNVDEDCDGVALFIDADNDGFNSSIDCDDNNPNINGRGIEIPNNGIDEDCDGEDLVTVTDFPDNDGDGFTSDVDCDDNNPIIFPGATEYPNNNVDEDCDGVALFIDADNDGFNSSIDCDDNNPNINGRGIEIPNNGIDEDCDGEDLVTVTDFPDNDGDGFMSNIDCDDNNPDINPDATEIPNNGIDEDCNGEDLVQAIDADNDGFDSDADCDDNNPNINPNATEIPNNGIDEDCNGEDLVQAIDADNDGFDSEADCDDNNPNINPNATEIPNNGIDEDCNGEDLVQAIDADNDGFDSDVDCDDNNPNINPNATEIPNNGIDEDCNGEDLVQAIDADNDGFDSDADCDDNNPNINPNAMEIPNNGIDEDCNGEDLVQAIDADNDGFDSDADCDDNNPNINPNAMEIPNNGIDEDCNGEDLVQAIDADNDGFDSDVDCDDNNPDINPDAIEIPNNGIDEDCNGEDLVQAIDADNDGFDSDADCDDNNPDINPDAMEIPNNGIDEDCNGEDLVQVDDDAVTIKLSNATATCGGQVCLDATAGNFKDLISFQYSLNWDPTLLGNVTTQNYNLSGLNNSAFFTPEDGVMRVSWFDTQVVGVSADDDQVIFQICFDVITSNTAIANIQFSSSPIPIEVIDNAGNEMATNFVDAQISIENCSNVIMGDPTTTTIGMATEIPNIASPGIIVSSAISNNLENIEVYPNPTVNRLNILLEKPLQQSGKVRLYDIWGKLLQTKPMGKEETQIELNLGSLTSGVYFVEVEEGNSFVRKRIVKR